MTLTNLCQHFNIVGRHPLKRRAGFDLANFGVRTQLRRFLAPLRFGEPSRYAVGEWVQVLEREAIKQTLDARSRMKGLVFLPYQWAFCGGVFRVQKVMQRIVDDKGIFRAVSKTILLEGVDCGGAHGTEGCGRHCPIMFRDEWVRPAPSELVALEREAAAGSYVRVRPAKEIRATLDSEGKRDGLMFMPEMYQWSGARFRVVKSVRSVRECAAFVPPRRPIYILEGLQCSGAVLGTKGPCDRRCSILWHADWLSDDR